MFPPAASSFWSHSKSSDTRFYRRLELNQELSEGYMLFRISEEKKRNSLPPPPRPLFTLDIEDDSSDTFMYLYQTTKRPATENTNHDAECSVSRVTPFNTLYTEPPPHHTGTRSVRDRIFINVCMETKLITQ